MFQGTHDMLHSSLFNVKHLATGHVFQREDVFLNSPSSDPPPPPPPPPPSSVVDPSLVAFHANLPHSGTTPLISLPGVAQELGVGHVLVKDESFRFGLPSFKILGASWAVFRAVCEETGLPPSVTLKEASEEAQNADIKLVTCTDGNWGRAVSRMAKYIGIEAIVFVPRNMDEATRKKLRDEGAVVNVVDGTYDDSIAAAIKESERSGATLVMDTSWDSFEQIPKWVVDGYSTLHREVDLQVHELCGKLPTLCIASVGVGSWAQSVACHYRRTNPDTKIITVESEAAPCLMESLSNGEIVPVETDDTIMCGMNCGTVSSIAWPVLKASVDAAVAVNDVESHDCVRYLNAHGVNAGPCGAAPLAALRKLYHRGILQKDPDAVIVLFSTEGSREYVIPTGAG